jgi:hypothetical protein
MSRECDAVAEALSRRAALPEPEAVEGRSAAGLPGAAAANRFLLQGEPGTPAGLAELPTALRRHAASCPACQRQLVVHGALAELLAGVPAPGLSSGFDQRLARRLAPKAALAPAARWALRLYALLAFVVSAMVLARLEPGVLAPPVMGATLVTLATLALAGLAVSPRPARLVAALWHALT